MPPDLSLASCDLDLRPTDLRSRTFHALALGITCTNLHQNQFISFQNIVFTSLVKDERTNKQTDRRTDKWTDRK